MTVRNTWILVAAGVVVLGGVGAALGPWRAAATDDSVPGEATSQYAGADRPSAAPASASAGQAPDYLIAQRTKGDSAAPLTLYEVGDFQCPACRLFFTETLPHILREYVDTGKLRIVYVNLPLVQIHSNAAAAHEFAMCAARQDRFWAVHDLLYTSQEEWAPLDNPRDYFMNLAESAELQQDSLGSCLSRGDTRALVISEAQSAFRAGVRSTPSFIIEGALMSGAAPIDAWRPILDSLYAEKTGN